MKLLAKALGFGLAVAAASTACAAAASLTFGSENLSSGSAAVTACTGLSSLSATRNVDNGGNVTQVVVPSLPAGCAGETISITLVDGSNASLGSASGTVPAGGGSVTFSSFGGTVSATSLASYRFAVVGA